MMMMTTDLLRDDNLPRTSVVAWITQVYMAHISLCGWAWNALRQPSFTHDISCPDNWQRRPISADCLLLGDASSSSMSFACALSEGAPVTESDAARSSAEETFVCNN